MAHRYLIDLMRQYSRETGNNETTLYDQKFLDWLKEYKETLLLLKQYYKEIGINLDSTRILETDKGLSDRIVKDINQQITHFYDPYEYIDYNKSGILVRTNSLDRDSRRPETPISGTDLVFTFNPYNFQNIVMYNDLANQNIPISIAMTGMLNDNYKKQKTDDLKYILQYLPKCEYVEKEDKDSGRYFKCIYSRNYIDRSKVKEIPKSTVSYGSAVFRKK